MEFTATQFQQWLIKWFMSLSAELPGKELPQEASLASSTKQTWKMAVKQRQRNQVKQKWRQQKAHGAKSYDKTSETINGADAHFRTWEFPHLPALNTT